MLGTMNSLSQEFKRLPISERIQLVEDLWDSIAEETSDALSLSPEDQAELQRRRQAHLSDPSTAVAWDNVRTSLFSTKT